MKLRRDASGRAHVCWADQILATVDAQGRINTLLDQTQRDVLKKEGAVIVVLRDKLGGAVAAYAAFNDGAYTVVRAEIRVADYLCDQAQKAMDGGLRPHVETVERALPGGLGRIRSELRLSEILRAGAERTAQVAVDAAVLLRGLPASIPGTAPLADALESAGGMLAKLLEKKRREIDPRRLPLRSAVEKGIFELREALDQMDGRLRTHFTDAFIESLYPELKRGAVVRGDEEADEDGDPQP